ncbi:MAG: formylglycine-generating enzyme family protein [Treponema sp.]|nr:formylglycine-generating enzyme family protein [Treponema sp.]
MIKRFLALALECLFLNGVFAETPSRMVYITGGAFWMGSLDTEEGRGKDEGPRHAVTVSDFLMARYEVTVKDFRAFVEATGYVTDAERAGAGYAFAGGKWGVQETASWKSPLFVQDDNEPVVLVSWIDAAQYCNWLSRQEGYRPVYTIRGAKVEQNFAASGYRLPTEAEWEYACRAGTYSRFFTGRTITTNDANFNGTMRGPGDGSSWRAGVYRKKPVPVGSFPPNAFGLFDMHGNVAEWCGDWYASYGAELVHDPHGPSSGRRKVIRGGGWDLSARFVRSAARTLNTVSFRSSYLGFRLARSLP